MLRPFEAWYTGDALGIAIMTPLYLSLSKRSWFMRRSWWEIVPLFAALFGLSWYVFWQDSLPLLFVIFPVLLLLEVRLGLAGVCGGAACPVRDRRLLYRGGERADRVGAHHFTLRADPDAAVFYLRLHDCPLHHGGGDC